MRNHLKFTYTNWRGEEHEYVIDPDDERMMFAAHGNDEDPCWLLSGDLITRDGEAREDMGPTRRRSFKLVDMKYLEEVPA